MKAAMSGTTGTIPYESKKQAPGDFARKCTASQIEPFSVSGSALIMTVPDCVTERATYPMEDSQERSHILQRKQYLRFVHVYFHSKIRRDRSRGIYANRIIVFEIEYTRDGFGLGLAEFQFHSNIAIIKVLSVSLRGCSIGCQVKEYHVIAFYIHVVSYLET